MTWDAVRADEYAATSSMLPVKALPPTLPTVKPLPDAAVPTLALRTICPSR
jgi:hypothetical protein